MAKVTFKRDSKGIGDFTRGPEMQKMVRRSGDAIARRAGPKFEADTWISPDPGRSGEPRAVSGVKVKPGSFSTGSRAAERVQQSLEAGRV